MPKKKRSATIHYLDTISELTTKKGQTKKQYFRKRFRDALGLSVGLFASDFVGMFAKKDNAGMRIGESTVFNYLKEFKEGGILVYDEKTRKYYLTTQAKERFAIEKLTDDLKNLPEWALELGPKISEEINKEIKEGSLRDETKINELGNWITSIALYCLGKEIETGQPFWLVLSNYLSYYSGARAFIWRHIVYKGTPDLDLPELFKLWEKPLGGKEEYTEAIASYFEDLKQIYKTKIEVLEGIFQRTENKLENEDAKADEQI
jgi:hypothetical protein